MTTSFNGFKIDADTTQITIGLTLRIVIRITNLVPMKPNYCTFKSGRNFSKNATRQS